MVFKNGILENLKINNVSFINKSENSKIYLHLGDYKIVNFMLGSYLSLQKEKKDFKLYDIILGEDIQFVFEGEHNGNIKIQLTTDRIDSNLYDFDDYRRGYTYKSSMNGSKLQINSDVVDIMQMIELAKTDSMLFNLVVDGAHDFDQRLTLDRMQFRSLGFFDLDLDTHIGNTVMTGENPPSFLYRFFDDSHSAERDEENNKNILGQKIVKLSFRYKDLGFIKRAIDIGLPGQSIDQVAEMVQKNGRQMAALLALDGEQATLWSDAVAAVIRGEGDLEITMNPPEPVSFLSFYNPKDTLRHKLSLLGISVKAIPNP